MSQRAAAPDGLPSAALLVGAALTPGVTWMAVLVAGSQLDEDVCSTGAVPHRGDWFGLSIRGPLVAMCAFAIVVSIAGALVLFRGWRVARAADGPVAETRTFIGLTGLLSLALFVPILVATIVELVVFRRC